MRREERSDLSVKKTIYPISRGLIRRMSKGGLQLTEQGIRLLGHCSVTRGRLARKVLQTPAGTSSCGRPSRPGWAPWLADRGTGVHNPCFYWAILVSPLLIVFSLASSWEIHVFCFAVSLFSRASDREISSARW